MSYSSNLKSSARRHFRAAECLYNEDSAGSQPGCKAVAGYLYGIAGELAIKQMMRQSSIPTLDTNKRNEDPYFAHFPVLKKLLATSLQGRRSGELNQLVNNGKHFQHWDIKMRYAPTDDIEIDWIESWKQSAKLLIDRMNIK